MLFNSPEFLFAFLPLFLLIYFLAPAAARNLVLFAASIIFYAATSAELTVILLLSVAANYLLALMIERTQGRAAQAWLVLSLLVNLLPLLYYKYVDFGIGVSVDLLRQLGVKAELPPINPLLPIGISFFTFQAISYIADVYTRYTPAERSLINFGMYHSCFPQLIAGPIVRYKEIMGAVRERPHTLENVYQGIAQFCFGLGKKVLLADNLGLIADAAFAKDAAPGMAAAWLGLVAYTLQIYFDFSGYSDMAIGIGRALGFTYPENFNQPYRALSVTEFWQRWHLTLSRWFRDYLYIPLGGNRRGLLFTIRNLLIVFALCGLWHGAAYTFLVWGLYHGALLVIERTVRTRAPLSWRQPRLLAWCYTIVAVMIGWVFFRANDLPQAFAYLARLVDVRNLSLGPDFAYALASDKAAYLLIAIVLALVPFERFFAFVDRQYSFRKLQAASALVVFWLALVAMSVSSFSPFIYFRF